MKQANINKTQISNLGQVYRILVNYKLNLTTHLFKWTLTLITCILSIMTIVFVFYLTHFKLQNTYRWCLDTRYTVCI